MAVLTRTEVQHVLGRHGVDVALGEADPDTLVTIAAAHGWLSAVEPEGRQRGSIRYHALVWSPTRSDARTPTIIAARRQGRTAAAALALALASMLARQERAGPPSPVPSRSDRFATP